MTKSYTGPSIVKEMDINLICFMSLENTHILRRVFIKYLFYDVMDLRPVINDGVGEITKINLK